MGVPTEREEQNAFIKWARSHPLIHNLLFHINNNAHNHITGRLNKLGGVLAGVSDFFLPFPRGEYCGLWLEMKRKKGYTIYPAQIEFLNRMRGLGYGAAIVYGCDHAITTVEQYLQVADTGRGLREDALYRHEG